MYFMENLVRLGEKNALVNCNKYINHIHLGCVYENQAKINSLCPEYVRDVNKVPDFFVNMLGKIF